MNVEIEAVAIVVLLGFAVGVAVEHARHEGDWMRGYIDGMADMRARFRAAGRGAVADASPGAAAVAAHATLDR